MPCQLSCVLMAMLLGIALSTDPENGAEWTTTTLEDPSIKPNSSDKAVAIGFDGSSFIIAVERTSLESSPAVPVLYKTDQKGKLLWSLESPSLTGTPFDIAVSRGENVAYIAVSSTREGSPYSVGHIVRFRGVSDPLVGKEVQRVVSSDIVFTTDSTSGNTKLFGCALDPSTGDLYITGGTSVSLYGESNGRSDVIVIRLSSSGQVLATIQFGSTADEFGRAVDVSRDSKTVAIAVQKVLESGGTESLLYRLDAKTLADTNGPQSLLRYAATPLYTPTDVSISDPLDAEPGTMTTVVTGNALAIPDRKTDMFYHIFAQVRDSEANVPLYVDGYADGKNNDYATAIESGIDGNFYSIGYSSSAERTAQNDISLIVISPTGGMLYKSGRRSSPDARSKETPSDMALYINNSQGGVAFIGNIRAGSVKRPTFGVISIPNDRIPVFNGFGAIVEGAEADSPTTTDTSVSKPNGTKTIPMVSGGIVGALVFLVAVVGASLYWRRKPNIPEANRESISNIGSQRQQNSTLV